MAVKKRKRGRHVPQRTCVGCRTVLAKRELIRIVRTKDGVQVDPTGKLSGRGAYLHDRRSCWQKGLQGTLAHALKVELSGHELEYLTSFFIDLPRVEDEPSKSL